jgi:hypothetical protein
MHTLFEQGGYMPTDHDGCRDKPAKYGVRNDAAEPVQEARSCQRTNGVINESLRKTMEQRDRRRSQKNQRRRHRHKQKMLGHMGRKKMMIESCER